MSRFFLIANLPRLINTTFLFHCIFNVNFPHLIVLRNKPKLFYKIANISENIKYKLKLSFILKEKNWLILLYMLSNSKWQNKHEHKNTGKKLNLWTWYEMLRSATTVKNKTPSKYDNSGINEEVQWAVRRLKKNNGHNKI